MRKFFTFILLSVFILGAFSGCGEKEEKEIQPTATPIVTYTPEPTREPVDEATVKEAYKNFIAESTNFGTPDYAKYYLYDVDNDEVDDLVIHAGTSDLESTIYVYTYLDGQVIYAGEAAGSYAVICGNSTADGIIIHYRKDGYEEIQRGIMLYYNFATEIISLGEQVEEYEDLENCVDLQGYAIDDYTPFE